MRDFYAVTVLAVVTITRLVRSDSGDDATERVLDDLINSERALPTTTDVEFIAAHDVQRLNEKIENSEIEKKIEVLRSASVMLTEPKAWLIESQDTHGNWATIAVWADKPSPLPNERVRPLYVVSEHA